MSPKFSCLIRLASKVLKFTKIVFRNLKFCLFVKGEETRTTLCLQLRACKAKELPLIAQSPSPDDVRSGMSQCFALHAFYSKKITQILKFHERVISALILAASFARPKISSQLLRVNGILKFENTKFLFLRI